MDEMTVLRALREDAPSPDHARLTPGRQRLLDEITRPARARRLRGNWKLAALGAAAAVTAAALLGTQLAGDTAERTLPMERPRADQWVRMDTQLDMLDCGAVMSGSPYAEPLAFMLASHPGEPCRVEPGKSSSRETWVRYDGKRTGPSDTPRTMVRFNGETLTLDRSTGETLTPEQADELVAALPNDPRAALRMIRKDSKPTRVTSAARDTQAQRDFHEITEVLQGAIVVPPEKAETLYRVITGLAGVTKPVHVTDGAGRPAIAIGVHGNYRDYSYDRVRLELLLEPKTYAFRGIRFVAAFDYYIDGKASGGPLVKAGTVTATYTRKSTEVVDKAGQRP